MGNTPVQLLHHLLVFHRSAGPRPPELAKLARRQPASLIPPSGCAAQTESASLGPAPSSSTTPGAVRTQPRKLDRNARVRRPSGAGPEKLVLEDSRQVRSIPPKRLPSRRVRTRIDPSRRQSVVVRGFGRRRAPPAVDQTGDSTGVAACRNLDEPIRLRGARDEGGPACVKRSLDRDHDRRGGR